MTLIWNWHEVLRKAWSIKWMVAAFVLSALEVGLPFFTDFFPPYVFAVMSMVAVGGAFVARLMAQKGLSE